MMYIGVKFAKKKGLFIIRKCFLVLKRAFIFEYLLFRRLQARLRVLCQGDSLFRNTNVVLLGPNTVFDCELEERIKCADIVTVVNKSYRASFAKKASKVAKKFIVFHCMDQREDVGGGQIDVSVLLQMRIKAIVVPVYDEETDRHCWQFHRNQDWRVPLFRVGRKQFALWRKESAGFVPNTGFAAIRYIIESRPKSLFVTGITFMRTPYNCAAYDKKFSQLEFVVQLIEKYRVHNPDHDFLNMREMYRRGYVDVDKELEIIFSRPYEPIFYLSEPSLIVEKHRAD